MNPEESSSNAQALTVPTGPVPVRNDFADAKVRKTLRDELRAEEWAMHQELMAAARVTLKNFYENPHKTTVADLARLIDLASRLGRLATETGSELEAGPDTGAVMIEFHAALRKVYARRESGKHPLTAGPVSDAEIIKTATVVSVPSLNPQP